MKYKKVFIFLSLLFLHVSFFIFAREADETESGQETQNGELVEPESSSVTEASLNDSPPEKAANEKTLEDTIAAEDDSRMRTIRFGTETEISSLIQTLKNENDSYLDEALITLIQNTKNRNILTGVFSFFGERNKKGLEERAIRAIEERDEETNATVIAAIDYLGKVNAESAVRPLMNLIDLGEKRFSNPGFRALGRAGRDNKESDAAAAYLIDYYQNREPSTENQREIVTAVGETGSNEGISFLSDLVEDEETRPVIRIAAIEALGKIGNTDGLPPIIGAITAQDPNVRAAAVGALGPFQSEEAGVAIIEAFRDSYYRTRLAAARAAKERKLAEAVPYLKFRTERDDVPVVRDEAIRALGEIGGEECMDFLETLFEERKNSDRTRILAVEMIINNDPDTYLEKLITEMDEAKQANQTSLYNGLLRVAGGAKTAKLETIARRFLADGGVIEKSYALDMAINNRLTSLEDAIRPLLDETKSGSLARKARTTLEKLGLSANPERQRSEEAD
ncbi:MAG: HEAT repeat domain-containing protein [Treponema sp.]|jgi:HEAT repeat protein|nr:HEAT repeat domain-containing protein [Treponema sp.]